MIARSVVLATLLLVGWCPAIALPLSAGQTFEFSFSTLPFDFTYPANSVPPDQGSANFFLAGDLLDLGDVVRFQMFETSFIDSLFVTENFSVPTSSFGVTVPYHWSDLQGAARIEVISGSINLDSYTTRAVSNGINYFQTSSVTTVPEPGTIQIVLLSLALLISRMVFSSRQRLS